MVQISWQYSQQKCLIYCRTSFFLIGFFTLSLVCIVLIFKFGVIPAIHPPATPYAACSSSQVCWLESQVAPSQYFFGKARDMASELGAVSRLPSGSKASEMAVSSDPSVLGGYYILVIMRVHFHPLVLIKFVALLGLGCGVLGFTLATIPKVNIDFVVCFDPIKR
jgi:hypothetical protein